MLGAIIAGGAGTRFGGDKGAALLNGKALIDHVADGLRGQVDALVICGRAWPGLAGLPDLPRAGLGPLGGLNAALSFAQKTGYDCVVTAGCDTLPVAVFPRELPDASGCFVKGHYLFGMWPSALAPQLAAHLVHQSDHSMRGWIAACGAKELAASLTHANLNTPADLARYARAARAAA